MAVAHAQAQTIEARPLIRFITRGPKTMNSLLALAIAAVSASVATYLVVKPKSSGGQAVDMTVFTALLKDIDDKLRDGRVDQATADAERERILQIIVSLSGAPARSASSNPVREFLRNPSALAAAAVAVVALFVFFGSENDASSLVAGGQQASVGAPHANSSSDPAVSQLQAYARSVQGGGAPSAAPTPARVMADAGKPADAPAASPMSKRPTAPALPMEGGAGKQPLADVDTMIERLAARMEKDPNNADGWRMLAWSYFATKNYTKAVDAYARAMQLKPDSMAYKAGHAEALVRASGDTVTPEAAAEFDAVLAAEPGNSRAVYFKGLAKEQSGDKKGALEYWTASLKAAPTDIEWAAEVKERIEKLGKETAAATPAPDAAKAAEPAKTTEQPAQEPAKAAEASEPKVEAPKEAAKDETKETVKESAKEGANEAPAPASEQSAGK